jgi:hypothetical protein
LIAEKLEGINALQRIMLSKAKIGPDSFKEFIDQQWKG